MIRGTRVPRVAMTPGRCRVDDVTQSSGIPSLVSHECLAAKPGFDFAMMSSFSHNSLCGLERIVVVHKFFGVLEGVRPGCQNGGQFTVSHWDALQLAVRHL